MSVEIIAIFLYLEWQSIQIAFGNAKGLGVWVLPVFIIAILGTLGFYMYKMNKLK